MGFLGNDMFLGKQESARGAFPLLGPYFGRDFAPGVPLCTEARDPGGINYYPGLPGRLPLALALRTPALTRSALRLRSSSATAPRTVKTIFPAVGTIQATDRLWRDDN
jgi:hypothetical protein